MEVKIYFHGLRFIRIVRIGCRVWPMLAKVVYCLVPGIVTRLNMLKQRVQHNLYHPMAQDREGLEG
jgi:hypothetical protein